MDSSETGLKSPHLHFSSTGSKSIIIVVSFRNGYKDNTSFLILEAFDLLTESFFLVSYSYF